MVGEFTLRVLSIKQQTADSVTIVFKNPALKKIRYIAGQYISLIFRINGRRYFRPYSFSSAPSIDSDLHITIKRMIGGVVSNFIIDNIKEGDLVEAIGPFGDFIIKANSIEPGSCVTLWGVGSGITPLFSIAKTLLSTYNRINLTLVYGSRNLESEIFKYEISNLETRYPDNFVVFRFYTQLDSSNEDPRVERGRIDPRQVINKLNNMDRMKSSHHYICGPSGLKKSVQSTLSEFGIPASNIFVEDFELEKDLSELNDIVTQNVIINIGGLEYNVEVLKGKSILEASLDYGIEMPYSCQTGNCSICKGKIIGGEVKQILNKHPDLKDKEYQLCCTYPLSSNVHVIV